MRKSGLVGSVLFVMFVVGCGGAYKGAASSSASESSGGAGASRRVASESSGGAAAVASDGASASFASDAPAQPSMASPSAASAPAPVAASAPAGRASTEAGVAARPAPPLVSRAEAPVAVAPEPVPRRPLPQSGQLTAGVWDDNRNFDFFKPYAVTFRQRNAAEFAMFAEQELSTARDLANAPQAPRAELDVQLVLDTTGSMGDELSYLQGEFDAIAAKVRARFPNLTPRWSLVVYRPPVRLHDGHESVPQEPPRAVCIRRRRHAGGGRRGALRRVEAELAPAGERREGGLLGRRRARASRRGKGPRERDPRREEEGRSHLPDRLE